MKRTRVLIRRGGAAPALLALVALLGMPVVATGGPVVCDDISPQGEIAVANNNLEEREPSDMRNDQDMQNFVNRLINGAGSAAGHQIKYAPDVLLLQEVRESSMETVAKLLATATGCRYVVLTSPGSNYVVKDGEPLILKETGIMINANTMEAADAGGHILAKYREAQSNPSVKVTFKNIAYGLARERDTGMEISLASVHVVKDSSLRTLKIAREKKRAWAKQIANKLKNAYPNAQLSAIGGDFNAQRCDYGDENCPGAPFWRTLTTDFSYLDSYWVTHDFGRYIDYIWGKKFVVEADEDNNYNQKQDPFYSDHQWRWAVLATKDVSPPTPFRIERADGYGIPLVKFSWSQSFDGGDLGPYQVLRAGYDPILGCKSFDVVQVGRDRLYENKSLTKFLGHCYKVRVSDQEKLTTYAKFDKSKIASETGSAVQTIDGETMLIFAGVR